MMRRFYSSQLLAGQAQVQLEGQVARHMLQVLRMQPGEQCVLFDGQAAFLAELLSGRKEQVQLALIQPWPVLPPSPLRIHLGQAISKGDKMDWIIQKATELGVSELTPLYSLHGDVHFKPERELKKWQQWRQIAISACEQSGRDDLPVIHPPQKLTQWLSERHETLKLLLHPHGPAQALHAKPSPVEVALLIGPEGGWAPQEIDQAQADGWMSLRLGPRVLRTETAPIAVLSILQYQWGDGR